MFSKYTSASHCYLWRGKKKYTTCIQYFFKVFISAPNFEFSLRETYVNVSSHFPSKHEPFPVKLLNILGIEKYLSPCPGWEPVQKEGPDLATSHSIQIPIFNSANNQNIPGLGKLLSSYFLFLVPQHFPLGKTPSQPTLYIFSDQTYSQKGNLSNFRLCTTALWEILF